MKNSTLLIVTLFLMFSKVGFGDESSHVANFNDYVNSRGTTLGSPVNKNINPIHATDYKAGGNPEKEDSRPVLRGIPAKWRACTIDNDCTAAVMDCVTWEALNKHYLKKLLKNLDACSASIDPGFQPETVCVEKECETTQKTTNVSWEEWLSENH